MTETKTAIMIDVECVHKPTLQPARVQAPKPVNLTPVCSDGLEIGTRLRGDEFTIMRRLSRGGFGITYTAKDNYLDRIVVLKECFPKGICRREGNNVVVPLEIDEKQYHSLVRLFVREAQSVGQICHSNVVNVHSVFMENGTAYMILDYVDGCDLLTAIDDSDRLFHPNQVEGLLCQMLDAVAVIHGKNLLHRDISPDNILLDRMGNAVLADFGAARQDASRQSRITSVISVVKDGYSPQEFYVAGGHQDESSDLYALAATFYHLISGERPINSQLRIVDIAAGFPDPCAPLAGRFPQYERMFLKAIDMAMGILQQDRLRSAQDWMCLIANRNGALLQKQVHSHNIEEVSRPRMLELISETNRYIAEQPMEPAEQLPVQISPSKKSCAPAWAEEFNRETLERKSPCAGPSSPFFKRLFRW